MIKNYSITDEGLYDKRINIIVDMLTIVREGTIAVIESASVEQLDYKINKKANSIGKLLFHIGVMEKVAQIHTFEDRLLNIQEFTSMKSGLGGYMLNDDIIGLNADYYKKYLGDIREITLRELSKRNDKWLLKNGIANQSDMKLNNFYKWFHVFEDELNHKGQIKLILQNFFKE